MKDKKTKLIEYNKRTILEAARNLFQEDGITKTTMDDIAQGAECSKATIYAYFISKEDIYYHIVLEYMTAFRSGVEQCFTQEKDYESTFYELCDILVNLERKYPMYFEYMLGKISVEQHKFTELPVLQEIYDIGEQINVMVRDFLIRGKNEGFVDDTIDSNQITFVVWASICGIISIASNKADYMENHLGLSRNEFLKNGFSMIMRTFRKEI